ncbi:MAG: hypothetical protein ABJN14_23275 [Paracoccaceae bacterium]
MSKFRQTVAPTKARMDDDPGLELLWGWIMDFDRIGIASSGDALLNIDLRTTTYATIANDTYLFATNGANGGLSSYLLREDGGLARCVDHGYFDGDFTLGGVSEFVSINGEMQLLVGGGAGSPLQAFGINKKGKIGELTDAADLGATAMRLSSVMHLELDAVDVLYSVDAGTGQLRMLTGVEGESFTALEQAPAFDVSGPAFLGKAVVANSHCVLSVDSIANEIVSYRVDDATGHLAKISEFGANDGLGLQTPIAMETVSAFGRSFVVVAGSDSNSLSVLEIGFTGQLEAVDHVLDTGATRFGNVQAMSVSQIDDRVFIVAGGGDDGLSLFTLLPDGRLSHVQTLIHEVGLGLQNVDVIETVIVGTTLQVFVGSDTSLGLTQFSVDLSQLGTEKRNWAAGDQFVQGSGGDDILMAGLNGHDTLNGRGGDDILVATKAGVTMIGGAGHDRFVLADTTFVQKIDDFEVGVDQLDLSAIPFLRNSNQIVVRETATGAELYFSDLKIVVTSATGQTLSHTELFGAGFDYPERVLVLSTPSGIEIVGNDGSEQLVGTVGDDTIFGNGGDDVLNGGDANDVLMGGQGDDVLAGQNGDDILIGEGGDNALYGGNGHDSILGGQGFDTVYGGIGDDTVDTGGSHDSIGAGDGDDHVSSGGRDTIWAGAGNDSVNSGDGNDSIGAFTGNDTIDTGAGNDTVWANHGDDLIVAGSGDDQIGGYDGNDVIFGNAGDDQLWGARGSDALKGGSGDDQLGGFIGNDTLRGDGGQDDLWGGAGDDHLYGGKDHDTLLGGKGKDRLFGGAGDDHITGGKGSDQMRGGAGADVFYFYKSQDPDRILDFEIGIDLIRIFAPDLTFADLTIKQQTGSVLVEFEGGTISVDDMILGDLSENDFSFG